MAIAGFILPRNYPVQFLVLAFLIFPILRRFFR
jgi:nitrate reductase NapE component